MARFNWTPPEVRNDCPPDPETNCLVPAVVLPGWKMPSKPRPNAIATAYHDWDGWWLHWSDEDGDYIEEEIPWPFDGPASAADMEALGFVVT